MLSKPLSSGGFALVLVNYSPKPRTVACEGTCMDLACGGRCTGQQFIVRDVWAKKNVGVLSTVQVTLEGGASAMFVLTGTPVGAALVRAA